MSLQKISDMIRARGNEMIYHDLDGDFSSCYRVGDFPADLRLHFSAAIVSSGVILVDPRPDVLPVIRMPKDAWGNSALQRGIRTVSVSYPGKYHIIIIRQSREGEEKEVEELNKSQDKVKFFLLCEDWKMIKVQLYLFLLCCANEFSFSQVENDEMREIRKSLSERYFSYCSKFSDVANGVL